MIDSNSTLVIAALDPDSRISPGVGSLCDTCRNLDWNSQRSQPYHARVELARASAANGCSLCALVLAQFKIDHDSSVYVSLQMKSMSFKATYDTGGCLRQIELFIGSQ